MATDTKVRPDEKAETATVHVKSDTEQDFHLVKELQEKAGDRIRERLLTTKLSPEAREDMLKLATELEESVLRLAKKSDGPALIAQVDKVLDKAEKYIEGVAEKEATEEKEKKRHEEKEAHYHGSAQKPKSADEITKEKADAKLKELRAEIRGEKESSELTAAERTKNAIERNKNVQQLKAEEEAYTKVAGTEASKLTGSEVPSGKNQKTAIPLDQIHKKAFSIPTGGNTTIHANNKPGEASSRGSRLQRVNARALQATTSAKGKLGNIKGKVVNASAKTAAVAVSAKNAVTTTAKAVTMPRKGVPPPPISTPLTPPKKETGVIKFAKGLFGGRLLAGRNISDRSDEDENNEYDLTETQRRYVTAAPTEEEIEIDENTETTGPDDEQRNTSRNADTDHGRNRWRPRRIPKRIMGRPGVPGLEKGLGGAGKGVARAGAQAGMALMRTPQFWIVVGFILIILLVFFLIFAEGKKLSEDQCQAGGGATETMKVTVTGRETAAAGDIIPFQITVLDTLASQEVTLVATIPQGASTLPADITSSWTRFTLTGNTITWKASENLPPNSLNPPNFNFTVSLKATAPSTNLVLVVDTTPLRSPAPAAPAPGGPAAPAGQQKSTQELMRIYGGTQAEVEAQLVPINFQGKSVRVHRLVQGAFEKVNAEITAANTGYQFRSVGTYNWRQKNCPGGCTGLSTHSFGITVDINPDTNPYTRANTHDIPPVVADIFKRNGFIWGGDWQPTHDWMHFEYAGEPGTVAPGTPNVPGGGSTNCPPAGGGGASGPISADYVPPSDDTCGGKYVANIRKNPIAKNFGDPQCNFTKDALHNLLRTEDPQDADFWFNVVVKCESGYNPNAHAGHAEIGTPDPGGAWGLYQMGSSTPPGSPPPAPGRGGQNDRGDVPWVLQTKNAVSKSNQLGGNQAGMKRYWACAR